MVVSHGINLDHGGQSDSLRVFPKEQAVLLVAAKNLFSNGVSSYPIEY